MGIGIQIKKPDQVNSTPGFGTMAQAGDSIHWFYYALLSLTFPAAIVALLFFFQTRNV